MRCSACNVCMVVDTWGCANNRSRTNIVPADHTSVVSDTLGLSFIAHTLKCGFASQMLQKFRAGELYQSKRASLLWYDKVCSPCWARGSFPNVCARTSRQPGWPRQAQRS